MFKLALILFVFGLGPFALALTLASLGLGLASGIASDLFLLVIIVPWLGSLLIAQAAVIRWLFLPPRPKTD